MIESGSPILVKNTAGTITFRNGADTSDLIVTATPAAHTHVPGDVIGTAVITNDSRLSDARTPTSHSNSVHSGATANLLAALTPTFSNWTLNPDTPAQMVNELDNLQLSTAGISQANSTITYDLGSSARRVFAVTSWDVGFQIEISDDNSNWYPHNAGTENTFSIIKKFRYVRFIALGITTFQSLKFTCYAFN